MAFLLKYRWYWALAGFFFLAGGPVQAKKQKYTVSRQVDSLLEQAMVYLDRSPDTSILICDKGIALLKDDHNSTEWASFHSLKGFAYEHLGLYPMALKEQFIALDFAQKHPRDQERLGRANNNVGVIYDYMGNLDSALYYYKTGYEIRKKNKDLGGISASAGNLGLLYLNKGNFKRALDYLFEAKKTAESIRDSSSLSSCLTNIGLAYDKQGNFEKALDYYKRSAVIDSTLNEPLNLALSYNNIGSVYFNKKDYDRALLYHNLALEIRTRASNQAGMSNSYHNLALVYDRKGESARAKEYYEKAMTIAKNINDNFGLLGIMIDLGDYYNDLHQYDLAISYLQQAIQMYEQEGIYGEIHKAYQFLSTSYAGKGKYAEAYKFYVKYNTIADSLQSYENSKKLTELEIESEYEKKKQEDAFKMRQRELQVETEKERARIEKKHARVVQWALMGGISLLLLVVVIIFRGYRNKQKANHLLQEQNNVITSQHREIEEQKNIIEEKNKNITDSIQYAQRLQNAILPPQQLLQHHLKEFFILYRPKDIVSGDFYWAHESPAGFLFAVVDCTGHGVPGSMVSIIANNALNRAVDEFRLFQPAAILNKVTELVEEYFNRNQNDEIRDGMDISLCLMNHSTQRLEFAGANNSLFIIRAANGKPVAEELKADKQPIGHYEHRKPYQNHVTQLYKGDMLYLYTDGYADQFGGQNGKKFKSNRLKEILLENSQSDLATQKRIMVQTLDDWTGTFEQNDDICLMGVRV